MSGNVPKPDRRTFLGALGAGGLAAGLQAQATPAAGPPYDVSKFETTDPRLVAYACAATWVCRAAGVRGIAAGPDGRIWVAAGLGVAAHRPDGALDAEWPLPERSTAVAVGPDAMVYAATRSAIHLFDPAGRRVGLLESPAPKAWFTGVTVTSEGVFVADSGNRVILRFDPQGKLDGRIGEKNGANGAPGLAVPSPYLTVVRHPDGNLRVNNTGRHKVDAYTPSGGFAGAWGETSFAIHGFCGCCNPVSIAALPDGRIVTAEKGLPRVKVHSVDGRFESVVAGVEMFPENAKAGSRTEGLHSGLGLAADERGRVLILDYVTGRVRVMQRIA
jgi:hypothetical protein